ncbi:CLUMA_CG012038, isoform A [Clunio marinus]|uniref:CLUMA_CG012038, isoform A n=1 Tax=Clunio marinus TaxID=568069 RepID=A0A1J1IEE8_9DIPT|nr:CLUMA_CG012038, isoform A [Clunio marinus]
MRNVKGSRGRRSINTDQSSTIESGVGNDAIKELSGLRDTLMGFERNIRAPKGFFGMRGKKDYNQQFAEKRALFGIQQNLNGLRERTRFVEPQTGENDGYPYPKRAPAQGFFGMRGKKFGDYDLSGSLNDKRAPKGFMGMRGKKSFGDDEDIDDPQVFDYNYNSIYEQNEKRAPTNAFMGMRGKRSLSDDKSPFNLMLR